VKRRAFLTGGAGTLAVAIQGCGMLPVIPKRPVPGREAARGWISHTDGRYLLRLPRAEMGQRVVDALKRVACLELGIEPDRIDVAGQDTARMEPVRATVGSDSIRDFAIPLAQACATLRDALRKGRTGVIAAARDRPISELHSLSAAAEMAPPPLQDGVALVTGRPLFAADIRLDGMVYGRVLRAPSAPDAVVAPLRWNETAAAAVPGFIRVVGDPALVAARSRGLGILAATPGALDRVAAALAIEWEVSVAGEIAPPLDVDIHRRGGRPAHRIVDDAVAPDGDWDVDLRFEVPLAPHGGIEPRAAVARKVDGSLEVWTGSQDVFYVRDVLARYLVLEPDKVHVVGCRIGGAFGGRTLCTVELEAAVLARAAGRPVKVQWTREQELAQGFHRPPLSRRIRARLRDGRLAAWEDTFVSSHILLPSAALTPGLQRIAGFFAGDGGVARGAVPPYRIGAKRIGYDLVRLPVHTGPWRGLGAGPNALASESAVDEAARAAGADPLAFRIAHAEDPRLAGVLRRVAAIAGWGRPPESRPGLRAGRGIACGIYKETSFAAVVADVTVDPMGQVEVVGLWCAHDCGRVVDPDGVRAQCEGNLVWGIAMVLSDRLPVEDGRVAATGFADAPIPQIGGIPDIVVELVTSELPSGGAGETAIVAAPGAVANAIRAATGIRPVSFPVDPAALRLSP